MKAELPHVELGPETCALLYLAKVAIEAFYVENEHLGQLDQHVAHFCLGLLAARLTSVVVVDGVLRAVVLQAFYQCVLVLERLCHEWVVRGRLVLALTALNSRLHDTGEDSIDHGRVTTAKVAADLLYGLFGVRAVEVWSLTKGLLLLQLL